MSQMHRHPCFVLLCCLMLNCGQEKAHYGGLFDLRGLLAESATTFATAGTVCRKQMQLNNRRERTELQRDSAGWMSEWSHLLYFDLSQRQDRNLYVISSSQKDSLKVVRYQPKAAEQHTKVEELTVISDAKGQLLSLNGKYRSEQQLYSQYTELYIEFSPNTPRPLMRSCSVRGYQKVFGEDTISYQVTWTYE